MQSAYSKLQTKKERVAFLKEKLGNHSDWALRGLVTIADKQTEEELRSESTVESNRVGFTAFDAELLTSIANQYRSRGHVSIRQMKVVYKRMPKYATQLDKIAQEKMPNNVVKISTKKKVKAEKQSKSEPVSQSLDMASSEW